MKKIFYILILFFITGNVFAQKEDDGSNKKGPEDPVLSCPYPQTAWYEDADDDGYGNSEVRICSVSQPTGYVDNGTDCDDTNGDYHVTIAYFIDNDGDGFGDNHFPDFECGPPPTSNHVTNNSDCDDNDASIGSNGITWYKDVDGDGFGDPNGHTSTACIQPTGYVDNNLDECPTEPGPENGCPVGGVFEDMNWIISKTYDINGAVTSYGKAYFDGLGKSIQTQSVDINTQKTWASQTMYDTQGRPALQTLNAPVHIDEGAFFYQTSFIKKPSGSTFTSSDFETNIESPSTVGNQVNSLGWYYSENNTSDLYQDKTSYPFSRTIFSELNPGSALKTIGGNKVSIDGNPEEWISGFTYTMPAAQEMYYAFGKGYFGEEGIVEDSEEVITRFYKTVSIDVHGNETVSFTDGEGKLLAAARSGGDTKYEIVSVIGEQKFVDIHIPNGIVNSDIQFIGSPSNYKIFDLRTEEEVPYTSMTGGNFYRVEYLENLSIFSDSQSSIIANGYINTTYEVGIRYKVNYYDYALNYYDKTGHLIETSQPLGFNESAFDLTAENPEHNLKSTFKYNALGQLLETTSPDEGTANFIYRADGQIRFSQNSEQAINNEFSYTNYDAQARPEESGVYDGPISFGSATLKSLNLIDKVNIKEEGNKISKTGSNGWNSGLATIKAISNNGYVQWKVANINTSCVGLSDTNVNHNISTIDFGIKTETNGNAYFIKNGSVISGTAPIAYTTESVFKVQLNSGNIEYKIDEVVYHTEPAPAGGLTGDFSFYSPDAKIIDFSMGGNLITPINNEFKNQVNVIVSGNTITKNAGNNTKYDAGLNTTRIITGDGSIEFNALQTDKYLFAGLSARNYTASTSYVYTDYSIFFNGNGHFYVYESGSNKGNFGTYSTTDTFRILRIGNMIQYLKNNNVFYTSTKASYNQYLVGDVSIKNVNAGLNLTIDGGAHLFKDYYNVATTGNEIKKLGTNWWSAGFASSETIANDGFLQFTAPKNTHHYMVGLSENNANYSYSTIKYALYLHRNQKVYVYIDGSSDSNGYVSSYEPGDVFKVARIGNTIRYYKNGDEMYNNVTSITNPLRIDASFYDPETYIEDLQLYDLASASTTVVSATDVLSTTNCRERHITIYDEPQDDYLAELENDGINSDLYPRQNFVAGNVSKTYTKNPNTASTWYSYDVYGRVEWMIQKIEGLGTKTIDYEYDPIKGYVTKVIYQKHKTGKSTSGGELFAHKYEYNRVGQLVNVSTSTNNATFTPQAQYIYNETGKLVRTVLADNLQGIDYVYNLAGQLKAINHPSLASDKDPGGDTNDVFGMHIDYYNGDYKRNSPTPVTTSPNGENRYDGNIKATRWATSTLNPDASTTQSAYQYNYNQNKWLSGATYGSANSSGTITPNPNNAYKVSNLTYDANGNLLSLNRNKGSVENNQMDDFTYNYNALTNQLNHVVDAIGDVGVGDLESQANDNYEYNSIGQLVKDTQDGNIIEYKYNASGLVTNITKNSKPFVNFYYDDKGKRVRKETSANDGLDWSETYYVRDSAGNPLAIYQGMYGQTIRPSFMNLEEHPIYGASRLGIFNRQSNAINYQLTDHLGNVRAVITSTNEITGATDYYPFGMPMPNRNVEGGYRYGYQGEFAEKETELDLGVNSFQLRMWDSRIARWTSPDPYGQFSSPYLGMGNNPINGVDPDGGCWMPDGTRCPDGAIGDTMVGDQGATWTFGENGWDTNAFDDNGFTVYGFLNANNENPIIGVSIIDIPVDMNTGEFLVKLEERLIANGFSSNLQVVPMKNVDFGLIASATRWWNNTPRSTLTIRNYHGYKDAGHYESGGYAVPGSNRALVYNGLGPSARFQKSAKEIYLYVNVSMHEIGHSNFSFYHDNEGHTDYPSGLMDYRGVFKENANYSPNQIKAIKSSPWGN